MFKKTIAVVSSLAISLGGVWLASPAHAGQLDVAGAKLSWEDQTFYEPVGCSRFTLNYENGAEGKIFKLEYSITSRFGDQVARDSVVGIDAGLSGTFNPQICSNRLRDGLGPYTVTLRIEDYAGSSREASSPLTFLSRNDESQAAAQNSSSSSAGQSKFVRCIKKSNFKQKRYKGKWAKRDRCPKGWIKITI